MASTKIENLYWGFLVELINSFKSKGLSLLTQNDPGMFTENPASVDTIQEYVKRALPGPAWVNPGDLVMFNYGDATQLLLVTGNTKTNSGVMSSPKLVRGKRSNKLLCGFKLDAADVENSYNGIVDLYKNRDIKYKQIVDTKDILGEDSYRTYLTNTDLISNFNEVDF